MSLSAAAPWLAYYGTTPATLRYPALTMYQLLRSTARAQRVYQAMECRGGFTGGSAAQKHPFTRNDWLYLAAVCLPCLAARAVDLPLLLGRLFVC